MEIKSYSRKELAELYDVSTDKLDKMAEPFQLLLQKDGKQKRLYYPNEVQLIIERYGRPQRFTEKG